MTEDEFKKLRTGERVLWSLPPVIKERGTIVDIRQGRVTVRGEEWSERFTVLTCHELTALVPKGNR